MDDRCLRMAVPFSQAPMSYHHGVAAATPTPPTPAIPPSSPVVWYLSRSFLNLPGRAAGHGRTRPSSRSSGRGPKVRTSAVCKKDVP